MSAPNKPFVYQTTFVKANGQDRTIKYIAPDDLSSDFKKQQIKGTRNRTLPHRSVLVWDIEANAFRTLNLNTIKETATPFACGYAELFEDEQTHELSYRFAPLIAPPPCTN